MRLQGWSIFVQTCSCEVPSLRKCMSAIMRFSLLFLCGYMLRWLLFGQPKRIKLFRSFDVKIHTSEDFVVTCIWVSHGMPERKICDCKDFMVFEKKKLHL